MSDRHFTPDEVRSMAALQATLMAEMIESGKFDAGLSDLSGPLVAVAKACAVETCKSLARIIRDMPLEGPTPIPTAVPDRLSGGRQGGV